MSLFKSIVKSLKKILGVGPRRRRRKSSRRKRLVRHQSRAGRKKASSSLRHQIKRPLTKRKALKKVVKFKPSRKVKSAVKLVHSSKAGKVPKPAIVPKNANKVKVDDKNNYPYAIVGRITHYFDKIQVCVVEITHGIIRKGDRLLIRGADGELIQKVQSMQIESVDVGVAQKGQLIGLKVDKPVRVKDIVYKLPS